MTALTRRWVPIGLGAAGLVILVLTTITLQGETSLADDVARLASGGVMALALILLAGLTYHDTQRQRERQMLVAKILEADRLVIQLQALDSSVRAGGSE